VHWCDKFYKRRNVWPPAPRGGVLYEFYPLIWFMVAQLGERQIENYRFARPSLREGEVTLPLGESA